MLEKIFRNLNDIRVFDVLYVEYSKPVIKKIDAKDRYKIPEFEGHDDPEYNTMDIVDILEALGYGDAERIQIQDSIQHLDNVGILGKIEKEDTISTGCVLCSYTDKLKLPRLGTHKTHKAYEEHTEKVPVYCLAFNDVTKNLFEALDEYNKRELSKHDLHNEEEF